MVLRGDHMLRSDLHPSKPPGPGPISLVCVRGRGLSPVMIRTHGTAGVQGYTSIWLPKNGMHGSNAVCCRSNSFPLPLELASVAASAPSPTPWALTNLTLLYLVQGCTGGRPKIAWPVSASGRGFKVESPVFSGGFDIRQGQLFSPHQVALTLS